MIEKFAVNQSAEYKLVCMTPEYMVIYGYYGYMPESSAECVCHLNGADQDGAMLMWLRKEQCLCVWDELTMALPP